MPLAVGNWWEYQVTEERSFTPPQSYKVKYEITATRPHCRACPAYVIEVTKDGTPQLHIMAWGRGATYLERGSSEAILIWDTISIGDWTETGLVVDFPLQCVSRGGAVPPGGSDYVVLYFETENEYKPETWREGYVGNVGLLDYYYTYKEYDTSTPPKLVEWRTVTYELADYNVNYE
jgi:hypothetical protein